MRESSPARRLRFGGGLARAFAGLALSISGACAAGPEPAPPCPDGDCSEPDAAVADDPNRREAREQVMAAEAKKEAEAFHQRMRRLRAEEELRARARHAREQTESAARNRAALNALAGSDRLREATRHAEPPLASERPVIEELALPASAPVERVRDGVEASRTPEAEGPPAEALLGAAFCVLDAESEAAHRSMGARRRAGAPREVLADWALAIVDLETLRDDVEEQLDPEDLANRAKVCANAPDPVRDLVRSLYGPGAAGDAGPRAASRGAGRLRRELEERAGLPAPK